MSNSDAPQNRPIQPGAWAPPAAAPFGTPEGGASPSAPGYAAPVGYTVAPLAAPAPVYGAGAPARRSSALGLIALALALVATVGAGIMGAIASYRIGLGAGREITLRTFDADFDWSILSPVRDWVLLGEVSFWVGTALGVWALVQGIVAIVTARGRGAGIAAVIVAALGPIVFGAVVQGFLTAGLAAGTGLGG